MASTHSPHDAAPADSKSLMQLRTRGGRALNFAIAAPLASGALLVVYAWLLAKVLGQTIEDALPLAEVMPMVFVLAGIVVCRALIGLIGDHSGQIAAEAIKHSLRRDLFGHLLAERRALGLKPASGAVSAALVDQVNGIENFFARYLPAMISAAVLPIAFAVVLFPIDWIVALLFLLTAPLIPLFMALAGWGAQAATDRQATALSRLSGHFADRLRGLLTLKLFGQEQKATADVFDASEQLRRRTNAVLRIAFLSSAILEFFAALGVACVALYVGLTYLGFLGVNPGLTLSAGLFALIMAPEVYNPLRQLAAHYHDRATARSALGEIERQVGRLVDLKPLPAQVPAIKGAKAPLTLGVRGMRVDAPDGEPIIKGLKLAIEPGTSLAIMGPSGIGKSTLARALARLIPAAGAIDLDGAALGDWSEPALRERLTYLGQKPHIFAGTIADNIALARPDADIAAITFAADRAHVTAFTTTLADGLQTRIGEGGHGLSGGQIQRIALARLFLRDPGLIILDEPTTHLDDQTRDAVLEEIFAFAQGRTLIVLTHAQSVADRADRVLRLAGGQLLPMPHRIRHAVEHKEKTA